MRIEKVSTVNRYTLIVFYTSAKCYQFAVVFPTGDRHQSPDIFYTPAAAEEAARCFLLDFLS